MIAIYPSGQKAASAQIIAEKFYYVGAILLTTDATAYILQIHNCSAAGTPSAANMVAELSVPGVANSYAVDSPKGCIECKDGIRCVLSTGTTGRYHVRGSALPF